MTARYAPADILSAHRLLLGALRAPVSAPFCSLFTVLYCSPFPFGFRSFRPFVVNSFCSLGNDRARVTYTLVCDEPQNNGLKRRAITNLTSRGLRCAAGITCRLPLMFPTENQMFRSAWWRGRWVRFTTIGRS